MVKDGRAGACAKASAALEAKANEWPEAARQIALSAAAVKTPATLIYKAVRVIQSKP